MARNELTPESKAIAFCCVTLTIVPCVKVVNPASGNLASLWNWSSWIAWICIISFTCGDLTICNWWACPPSVKENTSTRSCGRSSQSRICLIPILNCPISPPRASILLDTASKIDWPLGLPLCLVMAVSNRGSASVCPLIKSTDCWSYPIEANVE